jgi:Tfp pilus assembly pilus retraction ATPase PilT
VNLIDRILDAATRLEAQDVILDPSRPPMLRVGGELEAMPLGPLTPAGTVSIMEQITPEACRGRLLERGLSEFVLIHHGDARFHVSVSRREGGFDIAMHRRLPN